MIIRPKSSSPPPNKNENKKKIGISAQKDLALKDPSSF
jgi:hypothetical protein